MAKDVSFSSPPCKQLQILQRQSCTDSLLRLCKLCLLRLTIKLVQGILRPFFFKVHLNLRKSSAKLSVEHLRSK